MRGADSAKDMINWPTLSEMTSRALMCECCEDTEKLEEELRVRRRVAHCECVRSWARCVGSATLVSLSATVP